MAPNAQVEKTAIQTKRIAQVGPQQRRHDDRDGDQHPAHGGRAGFFLVGLRAFFADVLADLKFAQAVDDQRPDDQASEQAPSGWQRRCGT